MFNNFSDFINYPGEDDATIKLVIKEIFKKLFIKLINILTNFKLLIKYSNNFDNIYNIPTLIKPGINITPNPDNAPTTFRDTKNNNTTTIK